MVNRYGYPADGRAKPHTLANEYGFSKEVIERLSVLCMRDKDEFRLSKNDWENIFRAGIIIGSERFFYGSGYKHTCLCSIQIWASRVNMEEVYEKIIQENAEEESKRFLLEKLEITYKTKFFTLTDELENLATTFFSLYCKRPIDADLNLNWQKGVLAKAREKNTSIAWVYAANVIAATTNTTEKDSLLFKACSQKM